MKISFISSLVIESLSIERMTACLQGHAYLKIGTVGKVGGFETLGVSTS